MKRDTDSFATVYMVIETLTRFHSALNAVPLQANSLYFLIYLCTFEM